MFALIWLAFNLSPFVFILFTGDFYSQNSFNEFMIQNENPMQRINYQMDHSLVNSGW
jgi:hypothetical protein